MYTRRRVGCSATPTGGPRVALKRSAEGSDSRYARDRLRRRPPAGPRL